MCIKKLNKQRLSEIETKGSKNVLTLIVCYMVWLTRSECVHYAVPSKGSDFASGFFKTTNHKNNE